MRFLETKFRYGSIFNQAEAAATVGLFGVELINSERPGTRAPAEVSPQKADEADDAEWQAVLASLEGEVSPDAVALLVRNDIEAANAV